jgi:hypothetical protein
MSVDISQIEPIYGVKVENIKEESDIISQDLDVKTEKILPKSDIWVDGVRVDGYNTHLYEYDGEKFVTKNSTKGLLSIQEGASIKIWLDANSFDFIKEKEGCILIDDYVDNNLVLTQYPCYYDEQKLLHEALNESTDLNAVVEFTFRDNKWFYSGGLRVTYSGDVDITVNSNTTEEINVIGVNLGQYKDGDTINIGTSLEDILRNMLTNKIGVKISKTPKLTMRLTKSGPFEVGESVEGTINVSYQDGQFIGETGYNYTSDAGCKEPEIYTYKMNGVILENNSYNIPSISEGTTTFTVSGTHGQSTTIPIDNTGEELNDIKIDSATINTSTDIKAYYKYFYGYVEYNSDLSEITDETLNNLSSNYLDSNTETINSLKSTENNKPSILLVIPTDWEIISTKNGKGDVIPTEELSTLWEKNENVITHEINGKQYNLYVNELQQPVEYKEIIIKRINN